MDTNAIQVAVRVRPLTAVEASRIPEAQQHEIFYGDGALGGGSSPTKTGSASPAGGYGYGGSGLWREVVDVVDHRTLIFDKPDTNVPRAFMTTGGKAPPGGKRYKDQRYAFDRVFSKDSTQEEVFENTAKPVLEGLFDGFNATVFAYGATGCGKTHTVSGTKEDPGIIYRTMRELFRRIDESNDQWETHVTVSFLEIYNELIRDLLADDFPACPRGGLSLREDEKNRITVAGLSQKDPKTADEVLEYVLLGNSRRHTSPTHANSQSSRSHAVLQVNIGRRPRGGDTVDLETETVTTAITSATLSIIDLAGSERASATHNMGSRMKEGANINKSLLSLGNCINALCVAATRGNSQPHIPYRDSKLTRLLKFSLGGNCRTVMIVCVSPCSVHLEDTGNTLKYANRAKNIVTKVSRNVNDVNRNITQYLKAIAEKDARIKVLEAEMANGSRTENAAREKRLAEGRVEMTRVKADLKQAATRHAPVIADGALCRALVDGAELRISALRSRLEELQNETEPESIAERTTLERLIAREQTLYASNPTNQARIQDAATKSDLFSAVLRAASERRFDKLEPSDIEGLRVEAELEKVKSEMQSLEAREKAYRGAIAHQARALTRLTGGMVRTMTLLKHHAAGVDDELLGALVAENEATIAEVLGMGAAGDAPPRHVSPMFSITSNQRQAMAPPAVKPNQVRRRISTAPSVMNPLPVKPSPAMKRIQATHMGSPVRLGSPRKRSAGVAAVLLAKKKTLRWKDEAGEGSIDNGRATAEKPEGAAVMERESMMPPSSPLPTKSTTLDPEENAWIDEVSEEQTGGQGETSFFSARTSSMLLPPASRPLPSSNPTGIQQRLPAKRPSPGHSNAGDSSLMINTTMDRSPRRPIPTISMPKAFAIRPARAPPPMSAARAPLQTSMAANVNRQAGPLGVQARPAADKPTASSNFLVRRTDVSDIANTSVFTGGHHGDTSVMHDRSILAEMPGSNVGTTTVGLHRPTASSARRSSLSGTAGVGQASRRVSLSGGGGGGSSGPGPIRRARMSNRAGGLGAIGEEGVGSPASSSSERASHRSMLGLRKTSAGGMGDMSIASLSPTSTTIGREPKPRSSIAPGGGMMGAGRRLSVMGVAGLGGGTGASRPSAVAGRMSVGGLQPRETSYTSAYALPAPSTTTTTTTTMTGGAPGVGRLHQPTQASSNRATRRVSTMGTIPG
ncbi:hypothetical protein QFC22_006431 [Naganishia vaughanmartiniae]|uniref:Uncharacterized protein n=1 Tax=Naganishia vaughanmartiniae TaxID=1424756 RepID=A0ACC2WJF5_9TREE|nr:hypothetical protein QFC22_006431 [Naganishia vaughanmartiniae]